MKNHLYQNDIVIVNGIGKCDNKYYENIVGTVICRDPYFLDYNVKFEDNTEDWFDVKFLKEYKEEKL